MSKKSEEIRYRLNVAAILQNDAGKILIGERADRADAWQFPQGGVDGEETLEQALFRELWEEISLPARACRIVEKRGPYRYLFGGEKIVKGFHGKQQFYFRVAFTGAEADINVHTAHPEFRAVRWVAPEDFKLDWLPKMKREVYREVFRDFFSLEL